MNKKLLPGNAANKPGFSFDLDSIGCGRLRTSATYAAFIIQLEDSRCQQIDVLDSVMEALGIHPEEIIHNRAAPDCIREEERARWVMEGEELRAKLDAAQQGGES